VIMFFLAAWISGTNSTLDKDVGVRGVGYVVRNIVVLITTRKLDRNRPRQKTITTPPAAKKSLDSNRKISVLEDIILIALSAGAKIGMIYWIDGAFASSAARSRPRARAPRNPRMYALSHDARGSGEGSSPSSPGGRTHVSIPLRTQCTHTLLYELLLHIRSRYTDTLYYMSRASDASSSKRVL